MLTIVVGANGSGKSLWCTHHIVQCLRRDKRLIVTSVAIDPGKLNAYCQKLYGEDCPDVTRRLVVIDKEAQKTFWRIRGTEWDGEYGMTLKRRGPFGDASWQSHDGGVIYILDEAQTTFGAREWQKTGPEFCAYQSQHRHFSDDVVAVTPASALLDKQFRILAGECVALTNLYKLKVGFVKAPRHIKYRVFQNCPPLPGEDPLSNGTLHIDGAGLAACYDTAAGLGHVGGGEADKGKESKGLPFWSIFVFLLAGCVAGYFMLSGGLKYAMNWGVRKTSVAPAAAAPTTHLDSPTSPAPAPALMPGFGSAGMLVAPGPTNIWCQGVAFDRCYLSDGREFRGREWRMGRGGASVIIAGIGELPIR